MLRSGKIYRREIRIDGAVKKKTKKKDDHRQPRRRQRQCQQPSPSLSVESVVPSQNQSTPRPTPTIVPPTMSKRISFAYEIGQRVVIMDGVPWHMQSEEGYPINRRFVRRGGPAYRVTGAFFNLERPFNVYAEKDLLSLREIDEISNDEPWWTDYESDSSSSPPPVATATLINADEHQENVQ